MIQTNKNIDKLGKYVTGLDVEYVKKQYNLETVYKLASNENPYGISPKVKQAIADNLEEGCYYPDSSTIDLVNRISEFTDVPSNNIVCGNGSVDILAKICEAYINEGDECIVGAISYPMYNNLIIKNGGTIVKSEFMDFGFDIDNLISKITERTKIIFVANPNNPTGTTINHEEQLRLLQAVPSSVMVVVDEAYIDFCSAKDFPNSIEMQKQFDNLVIMRTFSKAYGLASIRLGYCMAHSDIIDVLYKVKEPFAVSTLAQVSGISALDDIEYVKKYVAQNRAMRNYVCLALEKMGVPYVKSHTNFILIDTRTDAKVVFQKLLEKGLILRLVPENPTLIRVTVGTDIAMDYFIREFKKIMKEV